MRSKGLCGGSKLCFLVITGVVWMVSLVPPLGAQTQSEDSSKPANTIEPSAAPATGEAAPSERAPAAMSGGSSSLKLCPGDLIEVSVYNVPELATKTRISMTGDVYLPLVDYVHVAGLTAEEAQGLIEKRFSDGGFVKEPHVALFVVQYSSQGVNVLGEVSKPGIYPVLGELRLLDIISAAGGFTDKAGKQLTITHRDQADKPVNIDIPRRIGDNPDNNVAISPGDTLVVHKADIVYVVGDVNRPSGFLMDRGTLTVLQAVALAGGTTATAKLNGAKIIRKGAQGMSETPVELKKILQAKAPDLTMQPDDILFVPTSQKKVFSKRGIEAAVQAATAVSIYAIR